MKGLRYTDSFSYRSGRKHTRIEYMEEGSLKPNSYMSSVISMRMRNAGSIISNPLTWEKPGYTIEKLEKNKELSGVYVLQSNRGLPAEHFFSGYMKRGHGDMLPLSE